MQLWQGCLAHITCNSTDSNYTWEIIDCCDNSARLLLPKLRVRCRSVDRFLLQQLMMLDYCTVHNAADVALLVNEKKNCCRSRIEVRPTATTRAAAGFGRATPHASQR